MCCVCLITWVLGWISTPSLSSSCYSNLHRKHIHSLYLYQSLSVSISLWHAHSLLRSLYLYLSISHTHSLYKISLSLSLSLPPSKSLTLSLPHTFSPSISQSLSSFPGTLESARLTPADLLSFSPLISRMSLCAWGQVSPVCALLGGVLGQEILKAVSGEIAHVVTIY